MAQLRPHHWGHFLQVPPPQGPAPKASFVPFAEAAEVLSEDPIGRFPPTPQFSNLSLILAFVVVIVFNGKDTGGEEV